MAKAPAFARASSLALRELSQSSGETTGILPRRCNSHDSFDSARTAAAENNMLEVEYASVTQIALRPGLLN